MEPGSSSGASSEGPPPNPVVLIWGWTVVRVVVRSPTATSHGKLRSYPLLDISSTITQLPTHGESPSTALPSVLHISGTGSVHTPSSGSPMVSGSGSTTVTPVQFSLTQQAFLQEYIGGHPSGPSTFLSPLTCPFPSSLSSSFTLETQPIPLSVAMPLQTVTAPPSRSKRPRQEW
ncbi:hypothetical protein NE237_019937 [Protea cynaroides]|uniref:Uncharacterized protein n=1 Tax=Protea cynaroides TaxID=273540 RepID=A0A9Q0H9N1_9MAGN|nr:hypothetical protein NE237_019937 [Protea cynaroides]